MRILSIYEDTVLKLQLAFVSSSSPLHGGKRTARHKNASSLEGLQRRKP